MRAQQLRRSIVGLLSVIGLLAATSCVPADPPPPPPTTVLSTSVIAAGGTVFVSAPDDRCVRGSYTNYFATVTMANGVVDFQGYGYWFEGESISGFVSNGTKYATVRVPPYTAPGTYYVYLNCSNYLESYQFSAAALTVTPYLG